LSSSRPKWIFRGHTDESWLLDSSLQRRVNDYRLNPGSATVAERIMLEKFKRTAHHFLQYPPDDSNNIEWLSILQHHGGITRLVDFTRSFYVALFFAIESSSLEDVHACVWCISQHKLEDRASELLEEELHYDVSDVKSDILYNDGRQIANLLIGIDTPHNAVIPLMPYRLNERMSIQQGIFLFPSNLCVSVMDNLYSMFDVHAMDEVHFRHITHSFNDYCVIKLVIPSICHKEIMADLNRMNITASSLFPGLDGHARSLQYVLLDPMA